MRRAGLGLALVLLAACIAVVVRSCVDRGEPVAPWAAGALEPGIESHSESGSTAAGKRSERSGSRRVVALEHDDERVSVEAVLEPAGRLTVWVVGEGERFEPTDFAVTMSPKGQRFAATDPLRVSADGSAGFADPEPGRWLVTVAPRETMSLGPAHRRRYVDVVSGEQVECTFRVPTPGCVHGRVFERGRPVGGVRVFPMEIGADPRGGAGWWSVDVPEPPKDRSVVVTDAEGHYAFDVWFEGVWELWALPAGASLATGPTLPVRCGPGSDVELDLRVGGASLVGSLRGAVEGAAWLFRLEEAGLDSFDGRHESRRSSHFRPRIDWKQRVTLGSDGGFRFDHVPPGTWLLRFGTQRPGRGPGQSALQVPVTVIADETVRLDELVVPAVRRVVVETPGITAGNARVHVRQLLDGLELPAWVDLGHAVDQRLALDLAPGRYELELQASGNEARLEVAPDGTVAPTVLEFQTR